MNIPINRNIEEYKQDAWKGLTAKEAIAILVILIVDVGGGLALFFLLHLNIILAIYLLMPINCLIGLLGFFPSDRLGMSMKDYIKMLWDVKWAPTLEYQTSFSMADDIRYAKIKQDKDRKKGRKK